MPIIIGAIAVGWLQSLRWLARFQKAFEVGGWVLLILSGLYLLNTVLYVILSLAM